MNRLMIIPAAGLGSRLNSLAPKVIFPVNGRPMIDYLFDLYAAVIERFIIVLHPLFEEEVRRYCNRHSLRIEYELQESPTGMLDAILIPQDRVQRHHPTSVWITWCDQIAVHQETIMTLAELSGQNPDTALIFPTVSRIKPYIHIVRNKRQEIIDILHWREGNDMPEIGESDIGLFSLSRNSYLELLTDFSGNLERGVATKERNFLPFIPWLNGRAEVRTFPARNEIESVGINTKADLRRVENYLQQ